MFLQHCFVKECSIAQYSICLEAQILFYFQKPNSKFHFAYHSLHDNWDGGLLVELKVNCSKFQQMLVLFWYWPLFRFLLGSKLVRLFLFDSLLVDPLSIHAHFLFWLKEQHTDTQYRPDFEVFLIATFKMKVLARSLSFRSFYPCLVALLKSSSLFQLSLIKHEVP